MSPSKPANRVQTAYLGLGSNLGDRRAHLSEALGRLAAAPEVRIARVSSVYETTAVCLPGQAAQPDYLLDSLLDPAKNVKEGYGSLVVVTADGQVTSGIPVSRSDTELVLRDSLDKEVRLRLADIEEEAPGTSLMPAGLVDGLSAEDLADLVRYLSALGR